MRGDVPFVGLASDPIYGIHTTSSCGCPEKLLMIGMLIRAFLDLNILSDDMSIRRSALKWFRSTETDYIFSYAQIKEYIPISRELLHFIENAVTSAENVPSQYYNNLHRSRSRNIRGNSYLSRRRVTSSLQNARNR